MSKCQLKNTVSPRRNNVLYKKPTIIHYNETGINNPSKAVDGIRDTDQNHGFCFSSQPYNLYYTWIKIDMLEKYVIDYVAITAWNSTKGKFAVKYHIIFY